MAIYQLQATSIHSELTRTTEYNHPNSTETSHFCNEEKNYTSDHLYTNYETISTIVILPLILCMALLTNLVFIYAVLRLPRMRTTTNVYLVSLAMTDLLYTTTGITEKLNSYIRSPINADAVHSLDISCTLVPLFKNGGLFASMFLVTVFSYERYGAVCHPLTIHRIGSKRRAAKHVTIACVLAFTLSASIAPAFSDRTVFCVSWQSEEAPSNLPDTFVACRPVSEWLDIYNDFAQTIPFFVVMIFSNTAYVLIVREIRSSARDAKLKRADSRRLIQESMHITRMLIVNGVVFFLLMAPFHILSLGGMISSLVYGEYVLSDNAARWIIQIVRILAYCNAVVDPIIYSAVNPTYRKAIKQVMCALKRRRTNSLTSYSTSYLLSERRPSNVNQSTA